MKKRGLPKMAETIGESRYGFGENDELIEQSLDELIAAVDAKDHKRAIAAIRALLACLESHEGADDAAELSQET